eukprot:760589-Hanusia_phi.AAC.3
MRKKGGREEKQRGEAERREVLSVWRSEIGEGKTDEVEERVTRRELLRRGKGRGVGGSEGLCVQAIATLVGGASMRMCVCIAPR